MEKAEIVQTLRRMATLLELQNENPFKIRAFENAAKALESVAADVAGLVESGELLKIKGIGKGIGADIAEMVRTGALAVYEELRQTTPPGLLDMIRIPGFGAKKANEVWQKLSIDTVEELEKAARDGRLSALPKFGEKTALKILEGIEQLRSKQDRFLISTALAEAEPIRAALASNKDVQRLEMAGSLRRWRETIKDIDFVVATAAPAKVMDAFVKLPNVVSVTGRGDTKCSVVLRNTMNCDLRCVTNEQFPFALHYFTGSKEHNTALRQRAKSRGLKLNEYGLFPNESEKSLKCEDEAALFKQLGLSYIAPELREDCGEIELAEKGELAALVEVGDLQGMVHFHTHYSDGKESIEAMARAAEAMGMKYIAVCDHSQTAAYAGGLKADKVRRQHDEIDEVQKKFKKMKILKGIESDILGGGELDYPDDILDSFDVIVASVHSRMKMSKAEMTARVVAAVENPHTTILGHATGRLLMRRDSYELDFERVFEAAAKSRTAIEINGQPHRMDLDWRLHRAAKAAGCKFSIGSDAHDSEAFAYIHFGIAMARKGGLTKEDIVNCWEQKRFLTWKRR